MPDKILVDGQVLEVNNQTEQLSRLAGLGLTGNLDEAEASAWRRFIPRRLPWKELDRYEQEIAKLEQRHREVEGERDELNTQLPGAPEHDLSALAEWERGGRRGPRPEPSQPKLEASVARCQEELLGLHRAIDAVTRDRASYVSKNRDRLVKEARKAAERAHERTMRLLGELEAARDELVESRRTLLWSQTYPSSAAGREVNWTQIGGGLKRVIEVLGVQHLVAAEQVFEALRADCNWIMDAMTVEQRRALEEAKPVSPADLDRVRNQQIQDHADLWRQGAQDQRTGELERMRRRL